MLTITLIALVLAIPLSSASLSKTPVSSHGSKKVDGKGSLNFEHSYSIGATISATLYTRIVAIALVFAAFLSYNIFPIKDTTSTINTLDAGLGLYSGLIHASTLTQTMEVFLLVSGAVILLPWANSSFSITDTSSPTIPEYPMIILFTIIGATFLLASADLVSMYLSIELQSFGVYILAAIYRDSEWATAAGLKYFLLGALSSALILLGSSLVYGYTGTTHLHSIYELLSVPLQNSEYSAVIILGFITISVGLLFKVASAPFHYWAPDVYDGTPTIVTTWLTVMPKISIFIFLLCLTRGTSTGNIITGEHSLEFSSMNIITALLLVCALLSLLIGTVVGLGQYRIKRLLAYSTISHVGFLLAALSVGSASIIAGAGSTEAFLFYIIQYTVTNIDAFFVLLAFGYCLNHMSHNKDINFTTELSSGFIQYPILGLSFAICLFSMAGVPPLVGFFAKYTILYSAIHNGYIFLALVAILASVVSAVYYLRIIRVIHFDGVMGDTFENTSNAHSASCPLTSVHSYMIASITLFILLFAVNPSLILNSTSIIALSIYVA